MRWQKQIVPYECNGRNTVTTYTTDLNKEYMIQVVDVGGGKCRSISGQEINHWIICICKKADINKTNVRCIEPNYNQKVTILKETGIWKQCALEVMPPQSEVVDCEDVYHTWEFQYPYSFFVDISPIFTKPDVFEKEYAGVKYHLKQIGQVRYLYFETDGTLPWREKQRIKNRVISFESTGVEIICSEMAMMDYSCLIILPFDCFLDFGLEKAPDFD